MNLKGTLVQVKDISQTLGARGQSLIDQNVKRLNTHSSSAFNEIQFHRVYTDAYLSDGQIYLLRGMDQLQARTQIG